MSKGNARVAVTREQVRAMLRKMLPEMKLEFEPIPGDRADESVLEYLPEEDVVPLQEEGPVNVLDRLDFLHGD